MLALLILAGGGIFLLAQTGVFGSRRLHGIDPRTLLPLDYPAGSIAPQIAYAADGTPYYVDVPSVPGYYRHTAPGNVNAQPPLSSSRPPAVAGPPIHPIAQVGIGAGTTLGTAAVTTGITSGVLAATGIGAAAAVLTWAIVSKGLFRGGEEGIRVNPMRDNFLGHFAPLDQWRDARNPRGFSGFAALVHHVNGTDALAQGVFRADTERAFKAAVDAAAQSLSSQREKTESGWAYLASISPFK